MHRSRPPVGRASTTSAVVAPLLLLLALVPRLALAQGDSTSRRRAAGDTAWGALYQRDLEMARAVIAEDHPGAVDRQNPAFARTLASAYDEARRAADSVSSYSAYRIALVRFGNRFQDAHLNIGARQPRPFEHVRDAGIYPLFHDGAFVVRVVDERYGAFGDTLLGATLVDCDGRPAAEQFRRGILSWRGRPSVAADWYAWAPYLLVDFGPPTIAAPNSCRFRGPSRAGMSGAPRSVALRWAPASAEQLGRQLRAASALEVRRLRVTVRGGGQELWVDVPTFAVDGAEVTSMRAAVDSLGSVLRRHRDWRLLVFDLRGNSGGSSVWGDQMAQTVFGQRWVEQAKEWLWDGVYTEWRVSRRNIEAVRGQIAQAEQRHGPNSAEAVSSRAFADSMAAALARGDSLYGRRSSRRGVARPTPARIPGKIVVVTSASCFSACLDFLDVMRLHPAVVQVGQPTGVDTDYMENWGWPLPSGLSQIGYPMKVYRNRRRANNTGYAPHVRHEAIERQDSLRRWIEARYGDRPSGGR